jgi:hypothetical protein
MYEQCFGPIPEGQVVRHSCDTPLCINPEHLILGTFLDNIQDKVDRGRCAKGSNVGPRRSITDAQARAIYFSKRPRSELAKEYGITYWLVWKIQQGTTTYKIDAGGPVLTGVS